jgi:hypothetical protein
VKPVVAATDFLGKPMAGTAPDAGAYEHQAGFTSLTRSGSPASPVAGRRTTELRILSVSARGSAFDLVGRNLPKRERKP